MDIISRCALWCKCNGTVFPRDLHVAESLMLHGIPKSSLSLSCHYLLDPAYVEEQFTDQLPDCYLRFQECVL